MIGERLAKRMLSSLEVEHRYIDQEIIYLHSSTLSGDWWHL